ncbi:MAG: AAA family ATPase [Myxococcales bacterium]|nr:AAA family ATPase [Myxococcales bacterium]
MSDNARQRLAAAAAARESIAREVSKRVFGQDEVVDLLLVALFSRAHTLMMGVPGLGKTLLVSTLSQALGLSFNRIQFTPDLMPSDITGTDILEDDPETGRRRFSFVPGPIFTNLLLADEINRTPPKTQAALLQAMQERQVTVGGRTYPISAPFLVFATQNPIEQEGTYPLPEAQLDRFMFHIAVDYPSYDHELEVARKTTTAPTESVQAVLSLQQILDIQELVLHAEVADTVVRRAVALVRATRPSDTSAPEEVRRFVAYGAGPRATQYLVLGAKAHAILRGYEVPSVADVDALARSVLRHRVLVNYQAEAEGVTSDRIVERVLAAASR